MPGLQIFVTKESLQAFSEPSPGAGFRALAAHGGRTGNRGSAVIGIGIIAQVRGVACHRTPSSGTERGGRWRGLLFGEVVVEGSRRTARKHCRR